MRGAITVGGGVTSFRGAYRPCGVEGRGGGHILTGFGGTRFETVGDEVAHLVVVDVVSGG